MELTPEAAAELAEVEREAKEFEDKASYYRRMNANAEARSWQTKWGRRYEKAQEIKNLGISTNEKKAVILSLPGMFTVSSDKSLGMSGALKVGYVEKLGKYVKVNYTKYSSFMRNVRGCASLAGSTDIRSIEVIPKQVYDDIVKGVDAAGGAKHEVNFIGHQESRGGEVIKKPEPSYSGLQNLEGEQK